MLVKNKINLGCGNAFGGTDEDADVGGDVQTGVEKVLDIQYNFNLVEYSFSKPDFMTYIKGYLKKVKDHLAEKNPDRVDGFMKGAQEFIKSLVGKFEEYTL